MGFENVFQERFDETAENALRTGVRGAFVEGCIFGVASPLIHLSEALLFYAGAILVSKGTYSYLLVVQVLNLVVFTVSISLQLMAFSTLPLFCRCGWYLMVFTCSPSHYEGSSGYS
jgi:ATP-binding cassette subfamily B (MDR/TAP) protein 1